MFSVLIKINSSSFLLSNKLPLQMEEGLSYKIDVKGQQLKREKEINNTYTAYCMCCMTNRTDNRDCISVS